MVGALMAAAPYLLQGASLLGGIFGNKRKHIDPEYLRQKFGPAAVSKDALELSNYIINSPYGQQLLANAAESGQQFENATNAATAASGLGAGGGASSGTGIFATSAGGQAQSGMERAVRGNIYQQAMPIAAQGVEGRQATYLADLQGGGYQDDKASMWQKIGEAAGQAAAMIPNAAGTQIANSGVTDQNLQGVAAGVAPAGTEAMLAPMNAKVNQSATARALSARKKSMASLLAGLGSVQRPIPVMMG